jgi:hypothetical protein
LATGNYAITGGAQSHAQAWTEGFVQLSSLPNDSVTVTLTGTPTFSTAFVLASAGSLFAPANTFVGGAAGPRYTAQLNGVIFTGGKSLTYFPGSAAGSTPTGGQYG